MGGYLRAGTVKARETVAEGIEQAVPAFLGLFEGERGEDGGAGLVGLLVIGDDADAFFGAPAECDDADVGGAKVETVDQVHLRRRLRGGGR